MFPPTNSSCVRIVYDYHHFFRGSYFSRYPLRTSTEAGETRVCTIISWLDHKICPSFVLTPFIMPPRELRVTNNHFMTVIGLIASAFSISHVMQFEAALRKSHSPLIQPLRNNLPTMLWHRAKALDSSTTYQKIDGEFTRKFITNTQDTDIPTNP